MQENLPANLPTLLTFGIENLKSELMNDPNFRDLLQRGYTVAEAVVLVNGAVDGPQTHRLGLIMVYQTPPEPPPAMVELPRWVAPFLGSAVALMLVQAILLLLLWLTRV